MAIAGRVAIVPKGDWSADATYKRLDAVTYNNTLYFAKKEVPAGTATSNTEYWSKSIVGGAGAIATKEDAGNVKPADGLTVAEDGTLKVNVDGTTLTMDQVNNVIKLADTLKEKINGAFPAANVVNNQITTETGYALDARQANPNIDGTLAKQLSDLNGSLKGETVSSIDLEDLNTGWKGVLNFTVRNGICYVSAWGVSHPDGTGANITVYDKMPKAAMNSGVFGELAAYSGSVDAFFFINYGTTLLGVHLNTTYAVYASFSYPILI